MQLNAMAGDHPALCSNNVCHSASCRSLSKSRLCSRGKRSCVLKQHSQVQRQQGCTSTSAAAVTASEACTLNTWQYCKRTNEHKPDSRCTFQVMLHSLKMQGCAVSILPARLTKPANCKCQTSTPCTMRCMGIRRGGLCWWYMVALALAAMQSMRKFMLLRFVHAKLHIVVAPKHKLSCRSPSAICSMFSLCKQPNTSLTCFMHIALQVTASCVYCLKHFSWLFFKAQLPSAIRLQVLL